MALDRSESNALNAQASTGPRSPEGKAKSATNAFRHGLTSAQMLVPGELPADFESLAADLVSTLCPVGALEVMLVERVVIAAWRLRRVARFDAAQVSHEIQIAKSTTLGTQQLMGVALARLAKSGALVILARYEVALERSLYRALHELERAQATRAGERVPLPTVIDVQTSERD